MGKCAAERMRKYRLRLWANQQLYTDHLNRDRVRKRIYRSTMTTSELITHRKLNRRAVRRHRYTHSDKDMDTEKEIQSTPMSYRSAQSLAKALHGVKRTLLRSPSKKAPIVKDQPSLFVVITSHSAN